MKKYKEILLAMLATSVLLVLAGCSKPILDYRNANLSDGLIYAENANEPFTGTVTHVPDNFLLGDSAGYTKFMQESGDQRYALAQFMKIALGNDSPVFLCTVSVRKGYADGKAPANCREPIPRSWRQASTADDFLENSSTTTRDKPNQNAD